MRLSHIKHFWEAKYCAYKKICENSQETSPKYVCFAQFAGKKKGLKASGLLPWISHFYHRILPRTVSELRGGFYGVDAVAGLDALQKVRLAGVVGGIDEV